MNEFRSQIFGDRRPLFGKKEPTGSKGQGGLNDVSVRREEARTTNTREDDRHRLIDQRALAIHGGARRDVDLINLSGGGAMIAGEVEARIGDRIDLEIGDGSRIEGVVRWAKVGRIGLEFAHETQIDCSIEQRAALFRDIIKRSFPDLPEQTRIRVPAPEPRNKPKEPAPEIRRSEHRHPLIWSGTITLYGHEAVVRLRNISARGALIESDITLSAGISLELDLGGAGSVKATVSWAIGDQAGLSFESEFDILKLSLSSPSVVPVEWDCPTYLKDSAKTSPWAEVWGRMSVDDLAQSLEGYLKR